MKRVFSDQPHPDPSFEFDVYATHLGEIAQEPTDEDDGALMIGILGSWGSGKTTLMRQIEKKFESQKQFGYKTIWFNAWKYEGKEAIWNALIKTVLCEIEDEITFPDTLRAEGSQLREKVNIYGHAFFAQLPQALAKKYVGVDFSESGLKQLKELYSAIDKHHYKVINRFEYDFKELVDDCVKDNGKLIIFVDDLDRCLPENALSVLEAIKLYLDNPKCVFFIGVDRKIIEQGVRHKYSESLGITGKDYIEKIILLEFYLPDKPSIRVRKELQAKMGDRKNTNEIWNMIEQATGCNLRKIKRFLYAFNLVERFSTPLGLSDLTCLRIARILLTRISFPDFYDELHRRYRHTDEAGNKDILVKVYEDLNDAKFTKDLELKNFIHISSECASINSINEIEVVLQLLR